MSAGGHRGVFLLEQGVHPTIKFSLPTLPKVQGTVSRNVGGNNRTEEDYTVTDADLQGKLKLLIGPVYCDTDWHPQDNEPLFVIRLDPAGSDFNGIFTTSDPYPDIKTTVASEYQVSYLPSNGSEKRVELPNFGLQIDWQNSRGEVAYLAVIVGYQFDPTRAKFQLQDGTDLEHISTTFYYIVIATPTQPDPGKGQGEWQAARLTIDLDKAANRLNIDKGKDRSNWNIYREDIREVAHVQQRRGVDTSPVIILEEIPNGSWTNNEKGQKNLFAVDVLTESGSSVLPLGQFLLCKPSPTLQASGNPNSY